MSFLDNLKKLAYDLEVYIPDSKTSAFYGEPVRVEDSDESLLIGYLVGLAKWRGVIFDPVNSKFKALVKEVYEKNLTSDELYEEAKKLKNQTPRVMKEIFDALDPYISKPVEVDEADIESGNYNFGEGEVLAHRHLNPDGTKGGWVADTATVAVTAYIGASAEVFGKAEVLGNAQVLNSAKVCDNAKVSDSAKIYGNAQIYGDAEIFNKAKVTGNATIDSGAKVYGNAKVTGNSRVGGVAEVFGNAKISGDAVITGNAKVDFDVNTGKLT